MFAKSPRNGVTMRHRQSSVMTETHQPVRSIGAAARAVCAACGTPAGGCATAAETDNTANNPRMVRRRWLATSTSIGALLLDEARVGRFDEDRGRHRGRRIFEVVVARRASGLHLGERMAFCDQVANPLRHDIDHVAILSDI